MGVFVHVADPIRVGHDALSPVRDMPRPVGLDMWISPRGSVWRLYVAGVVFSNRRVERTSYTQAASVEDMGVDHGDAHVGVPEELLDRPDVVSGLLDVPRFAC